MGTNYYLHKKTTYIPTGERPSMLGSRWYETWDHEFESGENHVTELDNGFVFRNTYYKDLDSLNEAFYETYHIGKCSAGWRFSLATYPFEGIDSLNDWIELFDRYSIVDEYGHPVSKDEMLDIIKNRAGDIEGPTHTFEYEPNKTYKVINGLIAHPHDHGCIEIATDGSYDMMDHWDFC